MLTVVLACLGCLSLGIGVGAIGARFWGRAAGRHALASLDAVNKSFLAYEADLKAQREETDRVRAQRDDEARKAQELFKRIDGIVAEATEARRLLVLTGAEHGRAQAMMLAEIESLTHQYRALAKHCRDVTGKPPPRPEPRLNSSIQVVAAEFREAHVVPYERAPEPAPVPTAPQTVG
jgi:hypothetical protein